MAYSTYAPRRRRRPFGYTKPSGPFGRPYKKKRYTRNATGANTFSVTAHNSLGYTATVNGEISKVVKVSDVTQCPIFQQFSQRYTKFRVKWISVKIVPQISSASETTLLTVLCRDDTDPLSSESQALRNVSVLHANMAQVEKNISRSLKLMGPAMSDWIRCVDASDTLGTAPYQQSIKIWTDNLMTDDSVKLYTSFGLEFMGLDDANF